MIIPLFAKVFIGQFVVIAGIIFVLIKILNKNLIELTVRQYELLLNEKPDKHLKSVTVISHKKLKPVMEERILKATTKHFGDSVKPVLIIDKRIKGGAIIKLGEKTLGHSLKDRLDEAFAGR